MAKLLLLSDEAFERIEHYVNDKIRWYTELLSDTTNGSEETITFARDKLVLFQKMKRSLDNVREYDDIDVLTVIADYSDTPPNTVDVRIEPLYPVTTIDTQTIGVQEKMQGEQE